jgi:hypothetical protein
MLRQQLPAEAAPTEAHLHFGERAEQVALPDLAERLAKVPKPLHCRSTWEGDGWHIHTEPLPAGGSAETFGSPAWRRAGAEKMAAKLCELAGAPLTLDLPVWVQSADFQAVLPLAVVVALRGTYVLEGSYALFYATAEQRDAGAAAMVRLNSWPRGQHGISVYVLPEA